jgi:hypothetical protein
MNIPNVTIAGHDDHDRAISAVTMSFTTDPLARWIWSEPKQYLSSAPALFSAVATKKGTGETTQARNQTQPRAYLTDGHVMHTSEKHRHKITQTVGNEGVQGASQGNMPKTVPSPKQIQHDTNRRWLMVLPRFGEASRWLFHKHPHKHSQHDTGQASIRRGRTN